uniref:Carboxylic ester hydrolase n=1 Tax=Lygus hesperus TaxID=30085 RepID=A0A0A9X407_LYGHE
MLSAVVWTVVAAVAVVAEQPEVVTTLGTIKGSTIESLHGRTIFAFEGVPYAKPPIGKHRFKQSVPGTAWAGVLNATRIPNMCMQIPNPMTLKNFPLDVAGSEDCLYMNIYTTKLPADLPDGTLQDVIVHIHGGAFQMLSGDLWGPRHLLDRDFVYVNFNYRMGVLGFLSLDDKTCPGNNGLKDQTLALKWINKHIAAFGGNPNSITITGISAGGASVHYHLLSPLSKGLFHKAIANSGAVLNPWALTNRPREKALVIANAVGCSSNDSVLILECLRDRPAEQLVVSSKLLETWAGLPINAIGPIIEQPSADAFIDQQPIDIIKSRTINDVPVIFSYTNDEGSVFVMRVLMEEKFNRELQERWDDLLPHVLEYNDVMDPSHMTQIASEIRKFYLGDRNVMEALPDFVRSVSERYFDNGIQEAAMLHAQHQASPVYAYRFSYAGEEGFNPFNEMFQKFYKGKAPHGYDGLFYYSMGSPLFPPIQNFTESLAMSKTMIDYWESFIKGTPVASWSTVKSGLPDWRFLDVLGPETAGNVFKTEKTTSLNFWNGLNLKENSLERMKSSLPPVHNEL